MVTQLYINKLHVYLHHLTQTFQLNVINTVPDLLSLHTMMGANKVIINCTSK